MAALLSPTDFGLVGLAYTVTGFAGLVQQAGLREILIHRGLHFKRWANPAFWMSLALGCLGAGAMLAAAPLAAWMYEEHVLIGLVLVLAIGAPFAPLEIVPEARLTAELRFSYLAAVRWISTVGTMGLSILFAHLHFGAYSFVLPQPIMTGVRLVMLWMAARPPVRRRLDLRRWKYLVNDSAMLFFSSFFIMLTWQGDYMVLGILHDAKTVGIYFFAFNLSIQTMQVLTTNLSGVLFPTLSKLQDDVRHQTRAFLQAGELLAMVGVPLCLLQAALAGPGIALLFNSFWYPAIRVLQLLSIGMAIRLVASPGGSLLQAQGRFGTYLLTNAANATLFIVLVTAGALVGRHPPQWLLYAVGDHYRDVAPAVLVAMAVMIYFAAVGPVFLYIAIRPGGGTWRQVAKLYLPPLLAGTIAIVIASLVARLVPILPSANLRQILRIAVIVLTATPVYLLLIRRMAPGAYAALALRLGQLRRRRRVVPTADLSIPKT